MSGKAHPFTKQDWNAFAGAEDWVKAVPPLAREVGEWMVIADSVRVEAFHGGTDESWFLDVKFPTQAAGESFLNGLPDNFDPEAFGFKTFGGSKPSKHKIVDTEDQVDKTIECYFCHKTADCVQTAIEREWEPTFYDENGEDDVAQAACPECSKKYLKVGKDGEMEMKKTRKVFVERCKTCPPIVKGLENLKGPEFYVSFREGNGAWDNYCQIDIGTTWAGQYLAEQMYHKNEIGRVKVTEGGQTQIEIIEE